MRCTRVSMTAATVVLVALLLAVGCQDPKMEIRSAYGPGVSYHGFGTTFDWWPAPQAGAADQRALNPSLDAFLQETIARRFSSKGYQRQTDGTPDLWIDYRVFRKSAGGLRNATFAPVREEGALVIDVLDGPSKRHVWRGYAKAHIDDGLPPSERRTRIDRAIQRILERFPSHGQE